MAEIGPGWLFSTIPQVAAAILGFAITAVTVLHSLEYQRRERYTDEFIDDMIDFKEKYNSNIVPSVCLLIEEASNYRIEDGDLSKFEIDDEFEEQYPNISQIVKNAQIIENNIGDIDEETLSVEHPDLRRTMGAMRELGRIVNKGKSDIYEEIYGEYDVKGNPDMNVERYNNFRSYVISNTASKRDEELDISKKQDISYLDVILEIHDITVEYSKIYQRKGRTLATYESPIFPFLSRAIGYVFLAIVVPVGYLHESIYNLTVGIWGEFILKYAVLAIFSIYTVYIMIYVGYVLDGDKNPEKEWVANMIARFP